MPTIKHWILGRRDQSPAPPVAHQLHHQLNGLYLPTPKLGISSPGVHIRNDKGYNGQAYALKCFQSTFCLHVFWLKKRNTKNTFHSYPMLSKKQSSHVRNIFLQHNPYTHFLVFADNF